MTTQAGFKTGLKVFLFWVIFLILYGLYKVFPVFPLSIICGINESNFQHYKTTFFTLLILNGIEYLVYRKQITSPSEFWYVRLLVATFAPWMVFLLWYLSPALKFIALSLFCISIVLYMVFTFSHLPWADVFIEANWR